jgi:phosphatidylinositol 4-phosphatase
MIRTISNYLHEFNYVVISRKELKRSGMRFLVRGIDKNGNVANFVESEQIVISKRTNEDKVDFVSYLQIRGSIPLFWTQAPNMELNPTILFDNENRENYSSFEKHTMNITRDYEGKIVYINLIDKKGDQNNIGEYLNTLHKEYKESRSKIN